MKLDGKIPEQTNVSLKRKQLSNQLKDTKEKVDNVLHSHYLTLNDKEVSKDMLVSIIGKRFH